MNDLNLIIQRILNEPIDDPDILSEHLVKFSAHLYNIGKAKTDAEIAYAKVWSARRSEFKSDKQCDMSLKAVPEYQELKNRESAYLMAVEVIRSLKKRLAVLSDHIRI